MGRSEVKPVGAKLQRWKDTVLTNTRIGGEESWLIASKPSSMTHKREVQAVYFLTTLELRVHVRHTSEPTRKDTGRSGTSEPYFQAHLESEPRVARFDCFGACRNLQWFGPEASHPSRGFDFACPSPTLDWVRISVHHSCSVSSYDLRVLS